jgi:hypothetical protein
MRKFKALFLAAAVSLALVGTASATIPGSAPGPAAGSAYEQSHTGAAAFLTEFKDALAEPKLAADLAKLPIEMAKLPGLKKAYVDAKNAGKEDEAKAALDAYTETVQTVIGLAVPLDQAIMPGRAQIEKGFASMGPDGAKLAAEKDIASLLADINAALKPLDEANTVVGPLQMAAAKATNIRVKAEAKKIFGEELGAQISNMLQGELAK